MKAPSEEIDGKSTQRT